MKYIGVVIHVKGRKVSVWWEKSSGEFGLVGVVGGWMGEYRFCGFGGDWVTVV